MRGSNNPRPSEPIGLQHERNVAGALPVISTNNCALDALLTIIACPQHRSRVNVRHSLDLDQILTDQFGGHQEINSRSLGIALKGLRAQVNLLVDNLLDDFLVAKVFLQVLDKASLD